MLDEERQETVHIAVAGKAAVVTAAATAFKRYSVKNHNGQFRLKLIHAIACACEHRMRTELIRHVIQCYPMHCVFRGAIFSEPAKHFIDATSELGSVAGPLRARPGREPQ